MNYYTWISLIDVFSSFHTYHQISSKTYLNVPWSLTLCYNSLPLFWLPTHKSENLLLFLHILYWTSTSWWITSYSHPPLTIVSMVVQPTMAQPFRLTFETPFTFGASIFRNHVFLFEMLLKMDPIWPMISTLATHNVGWNMLAVLLVKVKDYVSFYYATPFAKSTCPDLKISQFWFIFHYTPIKFHPLPVWRAPFSLLPPLPSVCRRMFYSIYLTPLISCSVKSKPQVRSSSSQRTCHPPRVFLCHIQFLLVKHHMRNNWWLLVSLIITICYLLNVQDAFHFSYICVFFYWLLVPAFVRYVFSSVPATMNVLSFGLPFYFISVLFLFLHLVLESLLVFLSPNRLLIIPLFLCRSLPILYLTFVPSNLRYVARTPF